MTENTEEILISISFLFVNRIIPSWARIQKNISRCMLFTITAKRHHLTAKDPEAKKQCADDTLRSDRWFVYRVGKTSDARCRTLSSWSSFLRKHMGVS